MSTGRAIDTHIRFSSHAYERARDHMGEDYEALSNKEIEDYYLDAVDFGLQSNEVNNIRLRNLLEGRSKKYHRMNDFRIFGGYIYVFDAFTSTAITMYPVPDYATYEKAYGAD